MRFLWNSRSWRIIWLLCSKALEWNSCFPLASGLIKVSSDVSQLTLSRSATVSGKVVLLKARIHEETGSRKIQFFAFFIVFNYLYYYCEARGNHLSSDFQGDCYGDVCVLGMHHSIFWVWEEIRTSVHFLECKSEKNKFSFNIIHCNFIHF